MLVVDASCLYVALTGAGRAEEIRARLAADPDHVAPHVVDVEVFGIARREHLLGRLDRTEPSQAVEGLEATLVTADARLAAAPGPTCRIELLG